MSSSALGQFQDPYNFKSDYDSNTSLAKNVTNEGLSKWGLSGVPGWIMKLIGFDTDNIKNQYQQAKDIAYERSSIESARAWSEYMENTQYQRRVEDLKKAGLNPWLAVQNGISGTGAPTVDTGGSAQKNNKSDQSASGLIQLILGILKLIG